MNYLNRHAKVTIDRFKNSFPSILVTGARQTGKTTLLKEITQSENVPYITFDDSIEEQSAKNDPKSFVEFHPSPILFDEIQYVPDLFRYLKIEIDKNRKNAMYYLTGSQQFSLMERASESLSESLSGRIGILQLYPIEIKKTASPNSEDVKNFFITNRIKNVNLSQNIIICNTDKVVSVKKVQQQHLQYLWNLCRYKNG